MKFQGEDDLFKHGTHVLGVFHDENKIDYALAILKQAHEKNESVMLVTDNTTKNSLRQSLTKEWKIDNLEKAEADQTISIKTPQEVFFPSGSFQNDLKSVLEDLTNVAFAKGKSGIRIFLDTTTMFRKNLDKEILKFETTLGKKFNFPCTLICAYRYEDLQQAGKENFQNLRNRHNSFFAGE